MQKNKKIEKFIDERISCGAIGSSGEIPLSSKAAEKLILAIQADIEKKLNEEE